MATQKYMYLDFTKVGPPVRCGNVIAADTAGDTATGATGDENILAWPGRGQMITHALGTQTLVAPKATATGLNITQDLTENDGVEWAGSVLSGSGPLQFTVGTDSAFFVEARFTVADVSGSDEMALGFRKVEPFQATLDGYDEMACLNKIAGDINVETIINAASNVTTDTTDNWADGATHTMRVNVSSAGVVTFQHDVASANVLAAPTATATYTFDDAEVVTPFIYLLNDATTPGVITLIRFECGYQ